ncbi:MAG: DUF835 domain-containing protein [Candidatus Thermoplasmatota archaeon]|nr:DUF835 domain-containing protein [Candidatus Thermoplasmatota archaeon]
MSPAVSSGSSMVPEAKPGNVYLVEERRPRTTFEMFDQALSSGYAGMVVTRDFPKKLLGEEELGNCRVLWLTNLVGESRINPTAIGILMGQMRSFIEGNPRTVVVVDGLEYLISLNTYDRMLQFMHQLRDVVVTNESILLVPVDPRTMTQRELALMERCMEPIVPKAEGEQHDDSLINVGDVGVLRLLDTGSR